MRYLLSLNNNGVRLIIYILIILTLASGAILIQTRPVEAADTPVGTNVSVTPFSQGVNITFSEVTVEGNSDVHWVQCGSPMGPGTGVRLSVPGLGQLYANAWFGKNAQGIGYVTGSRTGSTNMWYMFYYGDLLQYPVIVGKSWNLGRMYLNEGYVEGLALIESTAESVSVPAGTFDCVRISKNFSYSRTPHLEEIIGQQLWLAPGVGPVKSVNTLYGGTVITGELVTYNLSSPVPNDYFPAITGDSWQFHWDSPPYDEVYEVTEAWYYPDLHPYYILGPKDLFTTATYEGPVSLAVQYEIPWWLFGVMEQDLQLFQWDGTQWVDITTSVDAIADTIYAETNLPLSVIFVAPANKMPLGHVATATYTGTANFASSSGAIVSLVAVPESTLPAEGKPNLSFPHGFFSFQIMGLTNGQTVTVTITLPSAVPEGTQYWKYGPTLDDHTDHWYQLPVGSDDGDNVITITLVDGGLGDDDLIANAVIIDQGGPGNPSPPTGGCFIATAAYGTPMAEEIEVLREFRDEYLITNPVGEALMEFYYKVSPPMAEFINEHPTLKPVVRAGLVPVVAVSTVAVNTTLAQKMAMVGSLALVSMALAVWAGRRRGRGSQYS